MGRGDPVIVSCKWAVFAVVLITLIAFAGWAGLFYYRVKLEEAVAAHAAFLNRMQLDFEKEKKTFQDWELLLKQCLEELKDE